MQVRVYVRPTETILYFVWTASVGNTVLARCFFMAGIKVRTVRIFGRNMLTHILALKKYLTVRLNRRGYTYPARYLLVPMSYHSIFLALLFQPLNTSLWRGERVQLRLREVGIGPTAAAGTDYTYYWTMANRLLPQLLVADNGKYTDNVMAKKFSFCCWRDVVRTFE